METRVKIPKNLKRSLDVGVESLDLEKRTITLALSSEEPYERYFGVEILSHSDSAVDLSRLKNGAPVLFNHDMDKHIGTIEKAWIENKRLYISIRFGKSPLAEEKMQDVQDGILKKASVGYEILEMILVKKSENGKPSEYKATKWLPYEGSLVSLAADDTVGVGRSAESGGDFELPIAEDQPAAPIEENISRNKCSDEEQKQTAEKTAQERVQVMDENQQRAVDAQKAEKVRVSAVLALGEKYSQTELARQLIDNDSTVEQMRAAVLEKIGEKQKPITENDGMLGLSAKEIGKFSFMRAIQAMMNPNDRKAQEAAKFEREVSSAAETLSGKAARGFMIPFDVLRQGQRDLTVGTSTAGGHLVATDLKSMSFIELLRVKSVLQRAGAMTLNGLVGNIAIPRQTGGATAYWVGEGSAPSESQQSFDQVTMSPKTVGAFTDYSRKLMIQSSVDVEGMVRMDLATVIALAIDNAGLYGSGSANQPLGVKNTSGINTKDFAANAPTYLEMIDLETLVAADNADIGALCYLVNATGRGSLKGTEKFSGSGQSVWEQGNTVNGYRTEVSNQIAANDFWFGNFADLVMGFWSGLDLLVDPYTGSKEGNIRVVAHQDVDVAVRHPESFCRGNNTL